MRKKINEERVRENERERERGSRERSFVACVPCTVVSSLSLSQFPLHLTPSWLGAIPEANRGADMGSLGISVAMQPDSYSLFFS